MAYSFAVDRLINKLTNRFNISKAFFKVPKLKLGNFPCFPPTVVSETDRPEHWLNSGVISWLDTGITVYICICIYKHGSSTYVLLLFFFFKSGFFAIWLEKQERFIRIHVFRSFIVLFHVCCKIYTELYMCVPKYKQN